VTLERNTANVTTAHVAPYNPRMRRVAIVTVVLVVVAVTAFADDPILPPATWLLDQVRVLAADDMDGRQAGTPGADRAADYIARSFREAGLRPAGDGGTFRQAFTVPTGIRLGSPTTLALLGDGSHHPALGVDFVPLPVSDNGAVSGDVVFVGYGITAPDLGYDDYAGVDVRDKVVLALTREPRWQDPASPFRRPDAYHYAERAHKLINARQHGARALLLVTHPGLAPDTLPPLRGLSQPLGIVAVAVTRATADAVLRPAGLTVERAAAAIDGALAPRSRALTTRAQVEVTLVRERGTATNVVASLPGRDARLRDETVLVGAHYDHLGRGGEGSLAPDQAGTIHPGADDNASGTAVVLGLARAFAAAGGAPRTLVFAAFSGEEMGLLGSAHYVRQPSVALDKTVLMLNLDMVGRLRNGKLYVGGVDSGTSLRALVTDAGRALNVRPEMRGDPFAPSDHTSFYTAGRPVLFFFTGAHADYHRPTDTADRINAEGLRAVAALAMRVIAAVAGTPTPPAYVKVNTPTSVVRTRGAYGAFFGVIPEFGESTRPGVAISGVRPGSPAEKAGLRAGDVIVRFAGVDVKTLEDLTFALRSKRAGDRVNVDIVRGGQPNQVEAILEERR
jgi:peptidase M28-like protein/PDZ domain-containing protein